MSKIVHYDYRPELDQAYQKPTHIYITNPLNEQTVEQDDEVTAISVFISSKVTAKVIDNFPNLKTIMCRSAGTDHVDIDYAKSKWIEVHRVPGYGPHVIATHAIALFLEGNRQLLTSRKISQTGSFEFTKPLKDIANMTVWVIWTGKIGYEIIRLLRAFGAKVIAYDLYPNPALADSLWYTYVDIEKVYSDSEALFLACNASEENTNMINGKTIWHMKKEMILINIARGSLIDEDALLANADKFLYIWLDAIKNESKEGLAKFDKYENIIITPHIAYLADSTVKTIREETYKNLI